jgi:hypothetical protein
MTLKALLVEFEHGPGEQWLLAASAFRAIFKTLLDHAVCGVAMGADDVQRITHAGTSGLAGNWTAAG